MSVPTSSGSMYSNSMYDAQPSVWGTLTSSSFISLSFITPTPSHFLSVVLAFSVTINNNKLILEVCFTHWVGQEILMTKKVLVWWMLYDVVCEDVLSSYVGWVLLDRTPRHSAMPRHNCTQKKCSSPRHSAIPRHNYTQKKYRKSTEKVQKKCRSLFHTLSRSRNTDVNEGFGMIMLYDVVCEDVLSWYFGLVLLGRTPRHFAMPPHNFLFILWIDKARTALLWKLSAMWRDSGGKSVKLLLSSMFEISPYPFMNTSSKIACFWGKKLVRSQRDPEGDGNNCMSRSKMATFFKIGCARRH